MNERIKALAEQAGFVIRKEYETQADVLTSRTNLYPLDPELQKFAELIIKDCIDQIGIGASVDQLFADGRFNLGYHEGREDAVFILREHFGVEE